MTQYKSTSQNFDEASGINAVKKAATIASLVATCHSRRGVITSETTTLAADTVETSTITDKYCTANSMIIANVRGGGAALGALSVCCTPGAGSFTISVRNNTSATAANAAYIVDFLIINNND